MNKEKSKENRILIFAIFSLLFGILGIIVILLRIFFYRPWWSEYVGRNVSFLAGIIGLILGIATTIKISKKFAAVTIISLAVSLLCIILSIFLVYQTDKSDESSSNFIPVALFFLGLIILLSISVISLVLKHYLSLEKQVKSGIFANSGISIGILLILFWWFETCSPVQTIHSMVCSFNLKKIGEAILIYSDNNQGQYPDPDQWCDLVIKSGHIKKERFLCPSVKFKWERQLLPFPIPINRKSYYAMNPNCEPNSPPDTVLLFETIGGWNKSGGPELLTTENHRNHGCNILFNGGYVDFISTKKIADLKWE